VTRELRLRQLVNEHYENCGRSWAKLEEEIARAHCEAIGMAVEKGKKPPKSIDRRKLKALGDGKDVPLRISELEALDDFLTTFNQGLAYLPLFVRPNLLSALTVHERVHFLIGAREVSDTTTVSQFDTQAYGTLERQLNGQGQKRVTPVLDTILTRATREEARQVQQEACSRILEEEKVVVAIASPVANHGTDLMLAKMFSREPFEAPSSGRRHTPVALVLPEPALSQAYSSFVEGTDELRRIDPEKADEIHDRRWGLRLEKHVFVVDPEEPKEWSKTYGMIIAQRRASGQIWVVVAGLHGVGTHAAALALPTAEMGLFDGDPGQDGFIHVRVVEAQVSHIMSPRGNRIRKVESQEILTEFNRSFDPNDRWSPF